MEPHVSAAFVSNALTMDALRYSIHVLEIPPDISRLYAPCEDIGFQYSMEGYFSEFLGNNAQFTVPLWQYADFIWFPQCVSMVYWKVKNESGLDHHTALLAAERGYLKPIV